MSSCRTQYRLWADSERCSGNGLSEPFLAQTTSLGKPVLQGNCNKWSVFHYLFNSLQICRAWKPKPAVEMGSYTRFQFRHHFRVVQTCKGTVINSEKASFHYLFNSPPVCKAQKLKPAVAAAVEMSS